MNGSRFCAGCGLAIPPSADYCSGCGQPAPPLCGACGRPYDASARFCSSCGAPLRSEARIPDDRAPLTAGERKYVTVMFVDMIDSLAAIRDIDPEEAQELFSRVIGLMSEAVHSCGGTVARMMGDGIMALFGAPAAREDHALAACHAALKILKSTSESTGDLGSLNVRIGLHSGLVVAGKSISDLSVDYDATGAAVHIASRLQGAARPGAALLSEATRKLVSAEMATRPMGSIAVRGLDLPIEIFELCGELQARPSARHASDEIFVGRASELADLAGALRSALLGKGRFVALVGEAGVGKSRFIGRFLGAQARSLQVHWATIERYNGTTPFHPVRDLVLSLTGLAEVSPDRRSEALGEHLSRLDLSAAGLEAPLADLLGLGAKSDEWLRLDPPARSRMTASAVRALVLEESERRPLILVIEDVQRADSGTLGMIGMLADAIPRHRILFIVSFRPDFEHRWSGKEAYRQLRLERLNPAETDQLIDRLIGEAATEEFRELLATWSGGNPLYLHEAVRTMAEAGVLGGEMGSRVLLREPGELQPPDSITTLIAERIDRLTAAPKDALLAASVLGEQFPLHLLARLTGKPADALRKDLAVLEEHEFVRPSAQPAQPEFAFSHALVREVCYSVLLKRRRRQLHASALQVILAEHELAHAPPPIEQLAYHAFRGGLWAEAVQYCRSAGLRARFLSANREAVRQFENAIAALARVDPEGARLQDYIELKLELRAAHVPLLHLEEVGRILADVRARAETLGDRRLLAQITGFMAGHVYLTQNAEASKELSLEALRLAQQTEDRSLRVAPSIHLGQALHGLGRYAESVRVLKDNLAAAEAANAATGLGLPGLPSIMTARWIALSLAELGAFQEAESFVSGGVEAEAAHLRPFDRIYSNSAMGFVELVRGEFAPARDVTASALQLAEEHDLPFMIPVVASQLGLLLAYLGEHDRGVQLARRAVRAAEDIGISAGRSRWCARLAEACLIAGDHGEARRYAQTSLELAEASGEQGYGGYAHRLRGRIALAEGDAAAARADLTRAILRARRLGMAPLVAKCALDLGCVARLAGEPDRARRRLDAARREFQRLRMDAWAERAAREIASSVGAEIGATGFDASPGPARSRC